MHGTDEFKCSFARADPEGWRRLWEQAQREGDPKKLDAIIKQVSRLLRQQEERLLSRAQGESTG
jgi:hypothetical protein